MEKGAWLDALLSDESAEGRARQGRYFDVRDKMGVDDEDDEHHEIIAAIEARIEESL